MTSPSPVHMQPPPRPPAPSLPGIPEIETPAVNGTRIRCEDVTFGCSRLQNVIKVTPFYSECNPYLTLTRPTYFPDPHHFVFIS